MEWKRKSSKLAFVLALTLAACCGEDDGETTEPSGEKPQGPAAPDFEGMACSAKLQVTENACSGFASVCTRTVHLEGWCCIDNSQCGEPTDFR